MMQPSSLPAVHDADSIAPPVLLDEIIGILKSAEAVQIIGHVRPDGDCIGSLLSMRGLLNQWGIDCALAASALASNGYDKLGGFDLIREKPDPAFKADLTVYLDCATLDRGPEQWRSQVPVINIDHHASNTRYGDTLWIEPRCSSVGEMMFYLTRRADAKLTEAMATAMFTALLTDTGSFRYRNAGARQHRIAAELIEAGADPDAISQMAYNNLTEAGARLMGYVFTHITLLAGGRIAWSEVRKETYHRLGGEKASPENLSDCLRQIRGVEVSILFHELDDGGLRANFRSSAGGDVSRLAAEWGGGGHPAAAGLSAKNGDYEKLRDKIIARALELFG